MRMPVLLQILTIAFVVSAMIQDTKLGLASFAALCAATWFG